MSLAATVCDKSKADGTYFVDVTPGLYKMSFDGGPGLRLLSQWAYGRVDSADGECVRAVRERWRRERRAAGCERT